MHPYLAEFTGTLLLILLGNGSVGGAVLKSTKSENPGWLAICVAWGLAVALAIFAVGKYSGAHINPAVTLALAWSGSFEWSLVPGYMLAQFGGAFFGAVLVWLFYFAHWNATPDADAKLAVFCTSPAIAKTWSNFISEFLATAVLIMGILFLGAHEFTQGLKPLIVGLLVTAIGLSLGGTTGFAINPARDLAPRLAHFLLPVPGKGNSNWTYAWIPVVAPLAGGWAGAILYHFLFS